MRFSVVIPVYNVAPYLAACLDSIVSAAGRVSDSVEAICVDDGSTDGSGEVLDNYDRAANHQPSFNLRIVHQLNAGVSAVRNRGLKLAAGDWILFCDADDVVRDSLFSDLAEAIARHGDVDLFGYGLVPLESSEAHPAWNGTLPQEESFYDLRTTIPDLCAVLSACRFALRRKRFGDILFPSLSYGEDLVYVARVLARAKSLVYLKRDEYGYRMRAGSAIHSGLTADVVREAVRFLPEMFRILAASGKGLGSGMWQVRIEQWILRLPVALSGHGGDAEWRKAWCEWRLSMREALRLPYVTGVCRSVARLAIRCPFCPIAALAARLGIRILRWRHRR